MSAKPWAYREYRMRERKGVNWSFVRSCLRYRQEVRDLKRDGFEECRSWARLPFEGAKFDERTITETRIADGGTALWVRVVAIADTHPKDGDVEQAPLVSGSGSEGNRT